MGFDELIHYLRLGGITMGVILAASVVAVVVAIERAIALWGLSEQSRALSETIAKHLLRGDVAAGRSAAERADVPTADIYLAAFDRLDRTRGSSESLQAAVERERAQVGLRLRKHLWILGTIGATTPFVGLFGTVAGIMRSFRDLGIDVGSGGPGNTAVVMTGISEALITTAGGILVAVEAVILYNYFQSRLARVSIELRLLSDEFLELLRERPIGAASSSGPPPETPSALPAAVESAAEG